MLAKITSTIDVISGGRLDWGIGAGWYEHEYKGYGFEFPRPKERIGMLRESVEIVKSMWTQADTTYEGKHYTLHGAQCDPKPLQSPHPPIWIGGGGEQHGGERGGRGDGEGAGGLGGGRVWDAGGQWTGASLTSDAVFLCASLLGAPRASTSSKVNRLTLRHSSGRETERQGASFVT